MNVKLGLLLTLTTIFSTMFYSVTLLAAERDDMSDLMPTISLNDFLRIELKVPLPNFDKDIKVEIYLIPAKSPDLNKMYSATLFAANATTGKILYGIAHIQARHSPFRYKSRSWLRKRIAANHRLSEDYQIALDVRTGLSKSFIAKFHKNTIEIDLAPSSWFDSGTLMLDGKLAKKRGISSFTGKATKTGFGFYTIGQFTTSLLYDWNDKNKPKFEN